VSVSVAPGTEDQGEIGAIDDAVFIQVAEAVRRRLIS
jgi:hypothetical protein